MPSITMRSSKSWPSIKAGNVEHVSTPSPRQWALRPSPAAVGPTHTVPPVGPTPTVPSGGPLPPPLVLARPLWVLCLLLAVWMARS
ncbi:unnamed protein product [Arctogadus glacialis]